MDTHTIDTANLVEAAAYRVWRKFNQYVELDDLKQEIWAWVYSHTDAIKRIIAETEHVKDRDGRLMLRFTGVAETYARREKAAKTGYRPEDEWFYSTEVIARLLPVALLGDGDLAPAVMDNMPKQKKPKHEGNNLPAMVADVKQALKQLHQDKAELVYLYYGEGQSDEEIAGDYGVTPRQVRYRREAALKVLRRVLGGRRPYEAAS